MARAVLGPILTDLRGKLGTSVFDNYKGIHVVRSMPSVIVNPQSEYQTFARDALSAFVTAWKNLTLAQKQAWSQIACQMIKGQESQGKRDRGCLIPVSRGPFSAYNAFVSCNLNRHSSGFSDLDEVLETAPDNIVLPEPLKSFSATVTDHGITASWEYVNPGPRFERLEIWIKSTGAKVHRQLLYTEARNADGSVELTSARGRLGTWIAFPPGVYSLQARIVNKDGFPTAPSELAFVQIGGAEMFTYLATRLNILNLPDVRANIAYTQIDLSATIPEGAHSAMISVEATAHAGAAAQICNVHIRKDVAAGDTFIHGVHAGNANTLVLCESSTVPITIGRQLEYAVTDHPGAALGVGLQVYLIGYIE